MGYIKIKTNKKLGKMGSFNLRAIKDCPYFTDACLEVCYANTGCYIFANVKASQQASHDVSKQDDFADIIVKEIEKNNLKLVRVHASGDFYSTEYILKWAEIASRCPDVVFYAYTRVWVSRDYIKALKVLNRNKNFTILPSIDRDNISIRIPAFLKANAAYLSIKDEPCSIQARIIFRVKASEQMRRYKRTKKKGKPVLPEMIKRIEGQRVCPKESGNTSEAALALTCTKCKLCFK